MEHIPYSTPDVLNMRTIQWHVRSLSSSSMPFSILSAFLGPVHTIIVLSQGSQSVTAHFSLPSPRKKHLIARPDPLHFRAMNVRTFCGTPCSYPAGTSSARDLQRLHAQRCLSSIGGRTELRRQLYGQSFHQWELLRIRGVRSYGVGPKQSFVYVGSSHMRS